MSVLSKLFGGVFAIAIACAGVGVAVTGVTAQTTEQNIERNFGVYGGVFTLSSVSMADLMQ